MGWLGNAFNWVASKIKSVGMPVFNAVKKGWSVLGDVGGYIHRSIVPKVKVALGWASKIPFLSQIAEPISKAVDIGDDILGKALSYKDTIDKGLRTVSKFRNVGRVGDSHRGGLIMKKMFKNIRSNVGRVAKQFQHNTPTIAVMPKSAIFE